jgi:hypothetical protein
MPASASESVERSASSERLGERGAQRVLRDRGGAGGGGRRGVAVLLEQRAERQRAADKRREGG